MTLEEVTMKRKQLMSLVLAGAMTAAALTGCGSPAKNTDATADKGAVTDAAETAAETAGTKAAKEGEKEVLEFYHGYYHDESEWAPAKAMRDIYDEFAKRHADGPVEFKAIPTEDIQSVVDNKVAGGAYPDMLDLAGNSVSLAAISQGLLYDLKPYIDEQGLKDQVGLNYTQNDVAGKIYTIHDQLNTLGFWYNEDIITQAGATLPDTWKTWDDFAAAMEKVRELGGDIYAYGAGEGSVHSFNAALGTTASGAAMLAGELTADAIASPEFAEAFKTIAALDQVNGSANTSSSANDWSADFDAGKSAVFFNGVWAAGGFKGEGNFQPAIFPGGVALSSAGGGITVANNMSEEKTKLALEFVKYMTSEEVQTKIFKEVGANPCNSTLDLNELASGADRNTVLLAKACAQANSAATIVPAIDAVWGTDIRNAIANRLMEAAISGTDIDAKLEELKSELTALIG